MDVDGDAVPQPSTAPSSRLPQPLVSALREVAGLLRAHSSAGTARACPPADVCARFAALQQRLAAEVLAA